MSRKSIGTESELEGAFLHYWQLFEDGTEPCLQHRGIVKRLTKKGKPVMTNHRFDLAFPEKRVAIEIEGGVFSNGRHARCTLPLRIDQYIPQREPTRAGDVQRSDDLRSRTQTMQRDV